MEELVITKAENGYIVRQHKEEHNYINHWVAESVDSLTKIVAQLCLADNKKGDKK